MRPTRSSALLAYDLNRLAQGQRLPSAERSSNAKRLRARFIHVAAVDRTDRRLGFGTQARCALRRPPQMLTRSRALAHARAQMREHKDDPVRHGGAEGPRNPPRLNPRQTSRATRKPARRPSLVAVVLALDEAIDGRP